MTKITEHIRRAAGKPIFSIEVIPPIKGDNLKGLLDNIEPLMEFKPPFIDVTYHREEYVYRHHPNGLLEKKTVRRRPGTVGICAAIKNRFDVDTVPHLICGGFTKEETENALIDLHFLGIDSILALRGDPIKSEGIFKAEPDGHAYACDLIGQVHNLNKGEYLDEEQDDTWATNFCIGTAGYPEKHFEAPNYNADIRYLKHKVDRGADYIVTQMFFDNARYFDFVKRCRQHDIHIPIIPGLKPISTRKQLEILPRLFHLEFPTDLLNAVQACENDAAVRQVGIEWSIQQCRELIDAGAPVLHFYTMGKTDNIQKVARELF